MRAERVRAFYTVAWVAFCTAAPALLKAQGMEDSWKSFELVYFDPAAKPRTLSPFNAASTSELSTEMRIDYLRRYASELKQRVGTRKKQFLAYDVITDEAARERAAQIKERPLPEVRKLVPLRYWQWRLEPDPAEDRVPDARWQARDYQDEPTWNAMEAPRMFAFNRGVLLRAHFKGPAAKRVLLSVGSIVDSCDVWVNGRFAGRHDGFEPFTLDISGFSERDVDNVIALQIHNKPQDQIGIADDIQVIGVSDPYVSDLFVRTRSVEDGEVEGTLEIETTRAAGRPHSSSMRIEIAPWFPDEGKPIFSTRIPVRFGSGAVQTLRVPLRLQNVALWSPDAPHLYRVKVSLQDATGAVHDDLSEVTGFKRIEQRQGRLYLNGRPWFMKSFGEALGFAPAPNFMGHLSPPDDWIVRDFALAKQAHANTVRIHPWGFSGSPGKYTDMAWPLWGVQNSATNSRRIAWIADQLGIALIWTTRSWNLWADGFEKNYAVNERWPAQLEASLKYVRNHPSIAVYEGLNEVGLFLGRSLDRTRGSLEQHYEEFCRRYFEHVNRVDDTRLIIPDTPWGGLTYADKIEQGFVPDRSGPFHPLHLYAHIPNTFWTAHAYYGWYVDFVQKPILEKPQERPFVLLETGTEAMPDWSLYRGLRWHGIWLTNGKSIAAVEKARLGRPLRVLLDSEVEISQAYQGLSIAQTVFATRFSLADGININLIADGLAEGNYHKGVTDLYRRAKLGFFATQMAYQPLLVSGAGFDFVLANEDPLHLQVAADSSLWGKPARLSLEVVDESGNVVDARELPFTLGAAQRVTSIGEYVPRFRARGQYVLRYAVKVR